MHWKCSGAHKVRITLRGAWSWTTTFVWYAKLAVVGYRFGLDWAENNCKTAESPNYAQGVAKEGVLFLLSIKVKLSREILVAKNELSLRWITSSNNAVRSLRSSSICAISLTVCSPKPVQSTQNPWSVRILQILFFLKKQKMVEVYIDCELHVCPRRLCLMVKMNSNLWVHRVIVLLRNDLCRWSKVECCVESGQ